MPSLVPYDWHTLTAAVAVRLPALRSPLSPTTRQAGKGPWAIMKAIIKAKPELVGPLEDDAPHKTLGGDNSMCISAILSLDAFISGPFSPAQDPSADSFGFVPSLFSMGGSSSRSSTCSSQGSCGGLSSSQVRQGWWVALLLLLWGWWGLGLGVCCMSHSLRLSTAAPLPPGFAWSRA